MRTDSNDVRHMLRACEVAQQARGLAEPNPTVGCIIAIGEQVIAEGWTQQFGSNHAEVHALGRIPNEHRGKLNEATLYVTLEPCCHHGKTPPCTDAILASGIQRVVVAQQDPFPKVAGKGIEQLRAAGVDVIVGVCEEEAVDSIAPYLKRQRTSLPWIIAKWAMTLDGKIATASRDSKWISSEASREIVHAIRGRVDGVMVGIGTALADDPMLTARPKDSTAVARQATRIVVDSEGRLPVDSHLVQSAKEGPIVLAVGPTAGASKITQVRSLGVDVLQSELTDPNERLTEHLKTLCARGMTNILVEGGEALLGSLFDVSLIDEVHVFVAPIIAGGEAALSPIGGNGVDRMREALTLRSLAQRQIEQDIYISGRVQF